MSKNSILNNLHQNIINSECKYSYNLKKINTISKKGIEINNKTIKGGIIINNGYYGKCLASNSKLKIFNKSNFVEDITIENCLNKYGLTNSPDYDGLGYWYYPKESILINSIDHNKKIVKRKIRLFYKQKINELIREIELENGYKISITKNHRLLKYSNDKYQWQYELDINDMVGYQENNKVLFSKIKNINEYIYDNYVYDLSISGTKNYIANDILCHNTSRNILSNLINKNHNLIICPSWKKQFYKNINNNNTIYSINQFKKNNELSCVYKNIFMEIDINNLKNNELLLNTINNKNSKNLWLIVNNYKNNLNDLEKVISNYFDSNNINNENIEKLIIKNNFYIDNSFNFQIRKLKFNTEEKNIYNLYIEKFKNIYQISNIKFKNDEYLRKFCCFPQKNLNINYFKPNLIDSMNILGKYKENFIVNFNNVLNNSVNCTICLNDITEENMGITNCGHIFCYSCIFKSVNISKKCPQCRNSLLVENIYLYDIDLDSNNKSLLLIKNKDEKPFIKKSKTNKLTYQLESELLDNLGTKISYLIKMVRNLKYVIIFSNYDYNLKFIYNILKNLNIKSKILDNNKNIEINQENILLVNYNNNFNRIVNKCKINTIILNEPYYYKNELDKKEKYISMINCLGVKLDIYNLVMENSIEEEYLFDITCN